MSLTPKVTNAPDSAALTASQVAPAPVDEVLRWLDSSAARTPAPATESQSRRTSATRPSSTVLTDHGGSVVRARDAGVRHYEDYSLMVSPIKADAPPPPLDESRMHRLETVDRAEYVRLTSMSRPERSMLWPLTESVVGSVLVRASGLLGLSVPPVIRQVASALSDGEPVLRSSGTSWKPLPGM